MAIRENLVKFALKCRPYYYIFWCFIGIACGLGGLVILHFSRDFSIKSEPKPISHVFVGAYSVFSAGVVIFFITVIGCAKKKKNLIEEKKNEQAERSPVAVGYNAVWYITHLGEVVAAIVLPVGAAFLASILKTWVSLLALCLFTWSVLGFSLYLNIDDFGVAEALVSIGSSIVTIIGVNERKKVLLFIFSIPVPILVRKLMPLISDWLDNKSLEMKAKQRQIEDHNIDEIRAESFRDHNIDEIRAESFRSVNEQQIEDHNIDEIRVASFRSVNEQLIEDHNIDEIRVESFHSVNESGEGSSLEFGPLKSSSARGK